MPFKLLFGRELATPSIAYPLITDQQTANTEEYVNRLARELIKLQTLAFENLAFNVKQGIIRTILSEKTFPFFNPVIKYTSTQIEALEEKTSFQ